MTIHQYADICLATLESGADLPYDLRADTAERILDSIEWFGLALKPDNLVSPITLGASINATQKACKP